LHLGHGETMDPPRSNEQLSGADGGVLHAEEVRDFIARCFAACAGRAARTIPCGCSGIRAPAG
jgi:hypothetical protein